QREDRVQDRRARLEDLVEEGDVRLRQLVRREPPVVVLLERLQADRPEQLLRRGEAGEQPLEVLGPGDPAADLVGEHRLGRARREDRLVGEMIESSLKLLRDGTSLGDVKILNASLRELRYAFKVFAPYRGVRKVSVFGSARISPTAPAARAAREFARRIAAEG